MDDGTSSTVLTYRRFTTGIPAGQACPIGFFVGRCHRVATSSRDGTMLYAEEFSLRALLVVHVDKIYTTADRFRGVIIARLHTSGAIDRRSAVQRSFFSGRVNREESCDSSSIC